jgi:hypothetical protein
MKEDKTRTSGVGITGLLQVAFIVLKLCGVIKWSWWWVLCPSWLTVGFVLIGLIAAVVIAAVDK